MLYTIEQIAECVEKTIEEVEAVIKKRDCAGIITVT